MLPVTPLLEESFPVDTEFRVKRGNHRVALLFVKEELYIAFGPVSKLFPVNSGHHKR